MRLVVDGRVLDDQYHGIGRITEALLRELSGHPEIRATVVLRADQRSRRFDIEELTEGCGHETAVLDRPLTSPMQYVEWPRLLKRLRADAALFPYHLGAAVTGRGRRFSVVHDCIIETSSRFAPSPRIRWVYRALTSIIVRRTSVIAPSEASARDVSHFYGVDVDRIAVIRWGVDPSFAAPVATIDVVDGVRLPKPYFLHVGARRPHKNVAVLVEALALHPDHCLVLVGSIDERFADPVPELVRRLGLAGRVLHLPHVTEDELRRLYAGADAVLYPSLIEGVGLPLLEAMAAGVPVVASDIPVFREFGKDAVSFVDPYDPAEWARAARAVLEPDVRRPMIERGRRLAAASTWAACAAQLHSVLTTER